MSLLQSKATFNNNLTTTLPLVYASDNQITTINI